MSNTQPGTGNSVNNPGMVLGGAGGGPTGGDIGGGGCDSGGCCELVICCQTGGWTLPGELDNPCRDLCTEAECTMPEANSCHRRKCECIAHGCDGPDCASEPAAQAEAFQLCGCERYGNLIPAKSSGCACLDPGGIGGGGEGDGGGGGNGGGGDPGAPIMTDPGWAWPGIGSFNPAGSDAISALNINKHGYTLASWIEWPFVTIEEANLCWLQVAFALPIVQEALRTCCKHYQMMNADPKSGKAAMGVSMSTWDPCCDTDLIDCILNTSFTLFCSKRREDPGAYFGNRFRCIVFWPVPLKRRSLYDYAADLLHELSHCCGTKDADLDNGFGAYKDIDAHEVEDCVQLLANAKSIKRKRR
jgi:hypothetical protein